MKAGQLLFDLLCDNHMALFCKNALIFRGSNHLPQLEQLVSYSIS